MLRTNLGRPLLDSNAVPLSSLPAINARQSIPGRQYLGSGSPFSLNNIRDIWSAQVITLWVTNGRAFEQFEMAGIVTENEHNPSNLAPLNVQSTGRVAEDLVNILPKMPSAAKAKGTKFVMGPDGIYGKAFDSILAEYARTGKLFGANVPSNVKPVFDRLLRNFTSDAIKRAQSATDRTTASTRAADTPADKLTGDAQVAAGLTPTKTVLGEDAFTTKGGGLITKTPKKPSETTKATKKTTPSTPTVPEEDNTATILAIVGATAILGGAGYLVYKKRKANR